MKPVTDKEISKALGISPATFCGKSPEYKAQLRALHSAGGRADVEFAMMQLQKWCYRLAVYSRKRVEVSYRHMMISNGQKLNAVIIDGTVSRQFDDQPASILDAAFEIAATIPHTAGADAVAIAGDDREKLFGL